MLLYAQLAWEPSAAQVLKVSPAVYPHFKDLNGKINFC